MYGLHILSCEAFEVRSYLGGLGQAYCTARRAVSRWPCLSVARRV